MAGANVLPIIDTSGSMLYSGYVAATVTDSQAFVRSARPGDRIGVVSYNTLPSINYPYTGNQLVEVDFTLKQTKEAAEAIGNLVFDGITNISGGITTARTMMDPAPFPKGLVLLSDGYWNEGVNPLNVLPSYPVYSCAMGPASDQTLMRQIAQNTGGTYYYAPSAFDMTLIFNQIRGELDPGLQVVTNALTTQSSGTSKDYDVPISQEGVYAQFAYVWNDDSVSYTAGTPGANQMQVQLLDPNGNPWPDAPQVIGAGYVIFFIETAAAGNWTIRTQLGQISATEIPVTAGGFEATGAITLDVIAGARNVRPSARLMQGGEPLQDVTVEVTEVERLSEALLNELAPVGASTNDLSPEVAARVANAASIDAPSKTYRAVARGKTSTGATVQRTRVISVYQ